MVDAIPAFVICRNRLTWTRRLVSDCLRLGLRPVLVDNASTWRPLREWLARCPFEVIRFENNHGHMVVWNQALDQRCAGWYVVTDHDLDLSGVTADCIQRMQATFVAHRSVNKVGVSLEINDLPNQFPQKREVIQWESQHWRQRDGDVWDARVDTTFALYHRDRAAVEFLHAVRLDRPYTARHLPWYLGPDDIDDEERYYLEHCETQTFWSKHVALGPA